MRWIWVFVACALGAGAPATAFAAGGPVPVMQGGPGVSVRGSDARYVAVGARGQTLVRRVSRASGRLERSIRLRGRFGTAGVANDGSRTGLSANGRTLVLAEMAGTRFPPTRTRLVALDARTMQARTPISLGGYYMLDAISATGRWLYLIHYTSASDLTRYEVRAYDLPGRRLVAQPVVDPRERGAMQGLPVTRAMTADGRWAYTLYDRPGSTPFIHALDTQRRRAVCVDLPAVSSQNVFSSRLTLGPRDETLRIALAGSTVAVVDTRTFAVRPSAAPLSPSTPARHATPSSHAGGVPLGLGAIAAALVTLALIAHRRSRVRSAPMAHGR